VIRARGAGAWHEEDQKTPRETVLPTTRKHGKARRPSQRLLEPEAVRCPIFVRPVAGVDVFGTVPNGHAAPGNLS